MGLDRQLLSSVSIHLHISFILRFEMTGSERNSSFCPQKKKKKSTGRSYVLIVCIDGQQSTFLGKSAILPSDVMDFAMLPTRRLLAGIIFSAICHVITLYVDHI